jgi:hypothetical protein
MSTQKTGQLWLELDSGMQALLTTQITRIMQRVVVGPDLILAALVLLLGFHAMPKVQLSSRMSQIGIRLYSGLLFNSVLVSVQMPRHPVLTVINLLSMHVLGKALTEASISEPSKYLIIAQLVASLKQLGDTGTAIAWCLGHLPVFQGVDPDTSFFFRMASVDLGLQWLVSQIPSNFKFAGMLLILFFVAPLLDMFPEMNRLYKFAMFSVADDVPFQGITPWIQALSWWYVSKTSQDATFTRISRYASIHVLANGVLHATQPLVDKDPILVTVNLIVTLSILVNSLM